MLFTLIQEIKRMRTKTTFQKIYFYVSLIIVIALLVLIFCLSHQNGEDSTETSGWFTALLNFIFPFELTEDFVRTMAHFSEFACLSFFMNNWRGVYKIILKTLKTKRIFSFFNSFVIKTLSFFNIICNPNSYLP